MSSKKTHLFAKKPSKKQSLTVGRHGAIVLAQILKLPAAPLLQVGDPSAAALSCRRHDAGEKRHERVRDSADAALLHNPRALSATSTPKGANGAFTASLPTTIPCPILSCLVATGSGSGSHSPSRMLATWTSV